MISKEKAYELLTQDTLDILTNGSYTDHAIVRLAVDVWEWHFYLREKDPREKLLIIQDRARVIMRMFQSATPALTNASSYTSREGPRDALSCYNDDFRCSPTKRSEICTMFRMVLDRGDALPNADVGREAQGVKADPETTAIALLWKEPNLSISEIADRVHVDRSTLYRWPAFFDAATRAGKINPKGDKSKVKRGHKTKDGTVEAYSDDDD